MVRHAGGGVEGVHRVSRGIVQGNVDSHGVRWDLLRRLRSEQGEDEKRPEKAAQGRALGGNHGHGFQHAQSGWEIKTGWPLSTARVSR